MSRSRSTPPSARSRRGFTARFARAREGSAAIEFGMVAMPFVLMVFAILELGLVFVTDSILENAAIETGRLVRTGQASASGMTKEQFKTSLCSRMSIFSADCPSRARVDVRVIPQFATTPPDPLSTGTFDASKTTYNNGAPGDLMLVRVWYEQPLITTFLSQALSRTTNGPAILTATTAFRNEPA
ncbi:MAG TPA: TadE/TadG family type IV pilus assembly protein [Brevundimonas sp.]|nr:TadE/TadG family type IV pilus assembly protein [Brevundimonas sp.]